MFNLRSYSQRIYIYLFLTRNCYFQVNYMLICGLIHAIVIHDGLFVVLLVDPHTNHLFWPFMLLGINMVIFMVCCCSDPGVLSQHGRGAELLQHSLAVYPYDGEIFEAGYICSTCDIVKPARSKHCSVMNVCVFKFDHYCIWISNVIGGLNHRYFLGLLISLFVMCLHGALAIFKVLSAIVTVRGLWKATYLDSNGVVQPMDYSTLCWTLAIRYQRLFLSFLTVVVLCVIVGSFGLYHLVLALLNQTTNERYKRHYLRRANSTQPSGDATSSPRTLKKEANFYDRGLWRNFLEELFPLNRAKPVRNKKEN